MTTRRGREEREVGDGRMGGIRSSSIGNLGDSSSSACTVDYQSAEGKKQGLYHLSAGENHL